MSTYTYPEEYSQREIKFKRWLLWSAVMIPFILIGFVIYYALSTNLSSNHVRHMVLICALLFGCMFIFLFVTINRLVKEIKPVTIHLLSNQIIEDRPGRPQYSILRSQVDNIVDIPGQGIVISTFDPSRTLSIEQCLNDFSRFKSDLSSWHSFAEEEGKQFMHHERMKILSIPLVFVSFVILVLVRFSKDWEPVRVTLLLAPYLLWIVYQFVTGQCGGTIKRDESPLVYWYWMFSFCALPVLWFWNFDFRKIIEYRPEVLASIMFLIVIWGLLVSYIVKKQKEKRRKELQHINPE